MNPRWLLIRRLRGPAYLLTFGVTAVLSEWHILSFAQSWPLYIIVAGILAILERVAFIGAPAPPLPGYPYPAGWSQPAPPAATSTSITPRHDDLTPEGRQ